MLTGRRLQISPAMSAVPLAAHEALILRPDERLQHASHLRGPATRPLGAQIGGRDDPREGSESNCLILSEHLRVPLLGG